MQAIDKQALVTSAFDLLVQVFQARRASLMLRSAQAHDELIIARAAGLEEQVVRECRIRIGTPIAGLVVAAVAYLWPLIVVVVVGVSILWLQSEGTEDRQR